MTNEEFEKRMEFIIEHQARFASDIQQLQEAQARTEQSLARTEQALAQTQQAVARTEQTVAETGQIVTRLAHVTSEGFKDVTAKIDELVDSQIRTDDGLRNLTGKVDALVSVVDRYFREGRDGQTGR